MRKKLSKEDILQLLHMKHDDAASLLGVSRGTLSKFKKMHGIEVGKGKSQAHDRSKSTGRPRTTTDIEKICDCGKSFVIRSIKKQKTYCSPECYYQFRVHIPSDDHRKIVSEKAKERWKAPTQSMLDGIDKRRLSEDEIKRYSSYRNRLANITEKTYNEFKEDINPHNYVRGLAGIDGVYHLDHIIPAKFGFENGIPPEVLGSKDNLQMLPWRVNIIKGSKTE